MGNSVSGLRSLGEEIVPALFRGGKQLSELRRTSQGREHGIILHGIVGAVVSRDGALEQTQGDVLLSAEREGRCSHVPVLGVGTGQNLGRKLPGDVLHISGRRAVETTIEDLISVLIAQFL